MGSSASRGSRQDRPRENHRNVAAVTTAPLEIEDLELEESDSSPAAPVAVRTQQSRPSGVRVSQHQPCAVTLCNPRGAATLTRRPQPPVSTAGATQAVNARPRPRRLGALAPSDFETGCTRPGTPVARTVTEQLRLLQGNALAASDGQLSEMEEMCMEDIYDFLERMEPNLHLISQEALGGAIDDLDRADQAYVRIAECVTACRKAMKEMDRTKKTFKNLLQYVGLRKDTAPEDSTAPLPPGRRVPVPRLPVTRVPGPAPRVPIPGRVALPVTGQLVRRDRRVRSASHATPQRALVNTNPE